MTKCKADIYQEPDKRPLVILKCHESHNSQAFGNYPRALAIEAIKELSVDSLEEVNWALFYPECSMRPFLNMESICVVRFRDDDEDYLMFSRTISKDKLSEYTEHDIDEISVSTIK